MSLLSLASQKIEVFSAKNLNIGMRGNLEEKISISQCEGEKKQNKKCSRVAAYVLELFLHLNTV